MTDGRILIVDDEPQIRRVMRVALSGAGYGVADTRTGEEAIERLRAERFDLVLLDVNLPGMNGLDVCREIRTWSDVHILVLTVRDSERDTVNALDAGADDYITKPFSIDVLLARIRANLRRAPFSASSGPDLIRFGNVELRISARRVVAGGKEVRLTPKEFDLLRFLVANAGISLPHERILQAVWGPDYGDQVAYLRAFIKSLRKKIEPNPDHPQYITTEPWVGYRFNGNPESS